MLKRINKNTLVCIFLSFIFFSIFSILLFMKVKLNALSGAFDMEFHLRRVIELKESISHGNIFPEFSFNFFHGVPIMSMYPYLSIYPFALLLFIVPSVIKSYYIFIIIVIFIALLISFLSSLNYSKSVLTSYLFAISYGLSSTFIFEFFSTGDLGITTALSVLPLAIFGFIDVLRGSNNYLKLSLGLVLILSCQLSLFIIVIGFLLFWCIININKCKKVIIINFLKSSIICILLTSIIWIPMVYIILNTKMYSIYVPSVLDSGNLKSLLKNVGLISPFSIIISLFYFSRFNKLDKQMYLISLLICFMSTKFMPWRIISYIPIIRLVNQFQFSYRFLVIPLILLCYLFANCMRSLIQEHGNKFLIIIPVIIVVILQLLTQSFEIHHKLDTSDSLTSYKILKRTSTYGNYILINNRSVNYLIHGCFVNNDYYPKLSIPVRNQIFNNNIKFGKKFDSELYQVNYNKFTFYSKTFSKTLTLPFVYYNNEHLHMYINNIRHPFSVNKHRLINIHNVKRGHQILKIQYLPNKQVELFKYILFVLGVICIYINLVRDGD